MTRPAHPPARPVLGVLCVVGAPGAGKSMLVTALSGALRDHGVRTVAAARRERFGGGPSATVLMLPGGGRATVEAGIPLPTLRGVVAALEPHATLLLAEAYDDAGCPAIEVLADRAEPATPHERLLASLTSAEVQRAFGGQGDGDFERLVQAVAQRVAGREPAEALQLIATMPPRRRLSRSAVQRRLTGAAGWAWRRTTAAGRGAWRRRGARRQR